MYNANEAPEKLKERLCAQIPRLASEGFGSDGFTWTALKREDGFLLFAGDDVSRLTADELRAKAPLAHAAFCANAELDTVLFCEPEYCCILSREISSLPPVLDDMAQIVGPRAHVESTSDIAAIGRRMKRGFALIVRGDAGAPSGALTAGRSMEQAFTAALVLEKSARVYRLADKLGGVKPLGAVESALMHLIYTKKYSRRAEAAHLTAANIGREIGDDELALRQAVIDTCNYLTANNLVQGTWGNVSVRLDERYMLVTPSGMEYAALTPYDIVRVDCETLEYEGALKPTTEKGLHAQIYRENPDIRAVAHAHPPYTSVYAAAHAQLPISELAQKFAAADAGGLPPALHAAPSAKYALPGTKALERSVSAVIGENRACIMENHGIAVCGESLAAVERDSLLIERLAGKFLTEDGGN